MIILFSYAICPIALVSLQNIHPWIMNEKGGGVSFLSPIGGGIQFFFTVLVTYLGHLFSVCFRVQRSFCQENRVFFRSNSKFVIERVMPDLQNNTK